MCSLLSLAHLSSLWPFASGRQTQTQCVLAAWDAADTPDALFGLVAALSARQGGMRVSGGPSLYQRLPGKG